jgi:hypothetical protein
VAQLRHAVVAVKESNLRHQTHETRVWNAVRGQLGIVRSTDDHRVAGMSPGRAWALVPALLACSLLATLAASACGGRPNTSASGMPPASGTSPASASSPPATSAPSTLAHIFVVVMENKTAGQIIGSSQAPYLNALARRYALAADYSALFHPSLPNYIALTSGSNQGITDDRSPPTAGYAVDATNLADRLEASGYTWKLYAESIPSPGYASADTNLYATRHVPFLYYRDILDNPSRRRSHIVPFTELAGDLRSAASTPSFAFITPNLCNDMHDCPVSAGDSWLRRWVPRILASPAFTASPSLLVITWDEGVGADQRVATILTGSAVKPHYRSTRPYTHYSLLHTIEAAWRLRPLTTNDARAATMDEFLR